MDEGPVSIDSKLCSKARFWRSSCTLCKDICPHDAVSLDKGVPDVGQECTGCGLCAAVCPNGAIDLGVGGEHELFASIQQEAQIRQTPGFTCQMGRIGEYIRVPCLGRLGEHLLLAPFAVGARGVAIESVPCAGCKYEKGWNLFQGVVERGQLLCGGRITWQNPPEVQPMPRPAPRSGERQRHAAGDNHSSGKISRRAFFSAVVTPPRAPQRSNELPPVLERGTNPKREILMAVIREMGDHGLAPVNVPLPGGAFGKIGITDGCFGCVVCETLCPTGSILRQENKDDVVISFIPHLCTACRVCAEACLPGAVAVSDNCDLTVLLSRGPTEVMRMTKRRCSNCGEEFASRRDTLCLQCRKVGLNGRGLHSRFGRLPS